MAFNTSTARAPAQTNDAWKAQGFLNIYLPGKEPGTRRKLGAIPLYEAKASEKPMLDWLNEDPSRADKLLAAMVVEYQSAAPNDKAGFALPE